MRFITSFADQVIASVESVSLSSTYALMEGKLSSGTDRYLLPEIEERRALIEAGRLKGYYCFAPEFMDESEFWGNDRIKGKCLKDIAVKAKLTVSEQSGYREIILEWHQSTKELTQTPLPELVQRAVGQLRYEDIKQYSTPHSWY